MSRQRIVVIDDDVVTLRLLSLLLSTDDVQVETATDPDTGFELVRNQNPDLVILDVFMPGVDGFTLLSEIRHDPATYQTPVLMLTDEAQFKGAGLAYDLGVDAYLTKPFDPAALREKIQNMLQPGVARFD